MFAPSIRRTLAGAAAITVTVGAALLGAPARAPAAPKPVIPDSAMLQPADLNGGEPSPAEGVFPHLQPPRPCARVAYPSAALVRGERAISIMIGFDDRPTVLTEHVSVFQGNGAGRYLRELRRGVDRCTGFDERGHDWTVLATGIAGDESLLLRLHRRFDHWPMESSTYVAVVRVGHAVVVVADVGWEDGNGHEPLVREKIIPAVRRAHAVR